MIQKVLNRSGSGIFWCVDYELDFEVWVVLCQQRFETGVETGVVAPEAKNHSNSRRELDIGLLFGLGSNHKAKVFKDQDRLSNEQSKQRNQNDP